MVEIKKKKVVKKLKVVGVRLQRALIASKRCSDYLLWAVGSHWKILSREVTWWNQCFKALVLIDLIIRYAAWIANERVKSEEWEGRMKIYWTAVVYVLGHVLRTSLWHQMGLPLKKNQSSSLMEWKMKVQKSFSEFWRE